MRGGPSQVDTIDYKPELTKRHEEDLGGGRRYFQSPWSFREYGQCGLPVSDLFPHTGQHADDLCVINSMHTDIGNHPQAIMQMNLLHKAFLVFTNNNSGDINVVYRTDDGNYGLIETQGHVEA